MLTRFKIADDRVVETSEEKALILLYVNPDETEKNS